MVVRWHKRWLAVPIGVAGAAAVWAALASLDVQARRSGIEGGGTRSSWRLDVSEPDALPVDSWTSRFHEREEKGDWAGLIEDLDAIRRRDPDLYDRYQLGYLHARARIGKGDLDEGRKALEPFLSSGHPLRDLALHYAAEVAKARGDKDEAARLRDTLVVEFPKGTYRQTALEELIGHLTERGDPQALAGLAAKVADTVDAPVKRDLESRLIAARAAKGDEAAIQDGLRFLRGGNLGDDAAERVASALDRPEWLDRYSPEDLVLIGESLRNARHFDRAIELLQRALPQLPSKRDDLLFSIGRAYFGSERYAEAEKTYLEGAQGAEGEVKANFLYNASRCAQLLGDDKRAEGYLSRAIVPGGRTTRASSALTQRLRIRIKQRRFAEALVDLRTVQSRFRTTHAVVEATLAYAIGMIGAGRPDPALRELERIKPRLLDKKEVPEIQYWKARAVEARDPRLAARVYLKVLRADTPTHFAYFARHRLAEAPLAPRARAGARARAAEVQRLLSAGAIDEARQVQTDAVLLAPPDQEGAELARLAGIYRRLDGYREVLELPPPEYPRFPLFPAEGGSEPERLDLLLAMGLFDDGADLILTRYPLHPLPAGVARAEALRRAQASRGSIYAAEVVAREEVPDDYIPQLLPRLIRELLYPQYFYDEILAQSKKHGADPRLVVSIMREESRFNPRAKSAAAARGLLQFIITTARDVGQAVGLVEVAPEDLYDPRVIIQLGARYIADLLDQFERNGYKAAAAYNAGPNQARLWSRLAPARGDDMFLSAINFDETKDYVRKVLNSYERYGEIYESQPPTGGVRPEP